MFTMLRRVFLICIIFKKSIPSKAYLGSTHGGGAHGIHRECVRAKFYMDGVIHGWSIFLSHCRKILQL